jgi:uncharacterized membrane protein AbrB (regulator of aidB expression)
MAMLRAIRFPRQLAAVLGFLGVVAVGLSLDLLGVHAPALFGMLASVIVVSIWFQGRRS